MYCVRLNKHGLFEWYTQQDGFHRDSITNMFTLDAVRYNVHKKTSQVV